MTKYTSFADDEEKMLDFVQLNKADFLKSYSYLTEKEYDATERKVFPAKLVIRDPEQLSQRIWQYSTHEGFDWEIAINDFGETLQSIYDDLNTEKGGEIIDDGRLYVLGDVINFLSALDTRKEVIMDARKD